MIELRKVETEIERDRDRKVMDTFWNDTKRKLTAAWNQYHNRTHVC